MMLKSLKRNNEKGASAVEFALLLIPLVLILFGIIEFSLLLYNKQVITNASREGARAGIVAQTPRLPATGTGSITSVVNTYCSTYLITFGSPTIPTTTLTNYNANALFGDPPLTVAVSYPYTFLVIPNFIPIGNPITITATTVMRWE